MQRFVPHCYPVSRRIIHSSYGLNAIRIIKNPPNKIKYYSQVCDGIFAEYGISMFPEDINYWYKGFSSLFAYMAIDDVTDKLVSCCIGGMDEESQNGDTIVTGGCFYTSPEQRGTGISKEVLSRCINDAGSHNTGCYGFLGQTKGGTSCDKYTSLGYGLLQPHCLLKVEINAEDLTLVEDGNAFIVKDYNEVNWDSLAAYDTTVSSRKREKFMQLRLEPNSYTFTKVILDNSESIQGICCFRKGRNGVLQAGPFYSDSEASAYAAIKSALMNVNFENTRKLIFHYPSSNQTAKRLFERISSGKVKSTPYAQQQFNKRLVHLKWEKVYSVTDTTLSLV